MNKIKAIILDVDGVIVGEKIGLNAPYPHPDITNKLKQIREKGIYINLCSAKPYYSVKKIVDDARLNNIHTPLAGAVLFDPINNKVIKKHIVNNVEAITLIKELLRNKIYTEFYTVDNYFIQKDQRNKITKIHSITLSFKPIEVDSLIDYAKNIEIIKVLPIVKTDREKIVVEQIFLDYQEKLVLGWGTHPAAPDYYFGNITARGISKKQSVIEITNHYHIKAKEILGIGDSLTDWQFIGVCGFAGAMGNATPELKKLVLSKGVNGYVGKSVDKNGILDIFKYFEL